jgi:hypothetical protein
MELMELLVEQVWGLEQIAHMMVDCTIVHKLAVMIAEVTMQLVVVLVESIHHMMMTMSFESVMVTQLDRTIDHTMTMHLMWIGLSCEYM